MTTEDLLTLIIFFSAISAIQLIFIGIDIKEIANSIKLKAKND